MCIISMTKQELKEQKDNKLKEARALVREINVLKKNRDNLRKILNDHY